MLNDGRDAGAQYLDGDFAAVVQPREMHLRHRGAGNGDRVELREHFPFRPAVGARERRVCKFRRERRHLVLQPRKFVGNVGRQEVAARGQQLAEFDEYRAQRFECQPQPHRARRFQPAPEQQKCEQPAQRAHALMAEDEFVEPEAQADGDDFRETEQTHPRIVTASGKRRERRQAIDEKACA